MDLYGRRIQVIVGSEGQIGRLFFNDGASKHDLRVDFRAHFPMDGTPSTASVTIYNPPRQTLFDALRGEDVVMSIRAGYANGALSDIFSGRTVRDEASVTLKDGEVILTVNAASGGSAYREAFATVGRDGHASARRIAEDICEQAGFKLGVADFDDAVRPRGYYYAGYAAAALRDLARSTGTALSFDGDTVNFTDLNKASTGEVKVPLLSMTNGNLLDMPDRVQGGTRFRALLSGGLRPGSEVVLEYVDLTTGNSQLRATRERLRLLEVTYTGSNYGAEFYVEGVGRALGTER